MGIDHGGGDVGVAEQLLHGADVVAVLEQVGGEGMAERMAASPFEDIGGADGVVHFALDVRFVVMVAHHPPGAGIFGDAGGGKEELPGGIGRGGG